MKASEEVNLIDGVKLKMRCFALNANSGGDDDDVAESSDDLIMEKFKLSYNLAYETAFDFECLTLSPSKINMNRNGNLYWASIE